MTTYHIIYGMVYGAHCVFTGYLPPGITTSFLTDEAWPGCFQTKQLAHQIEYTGPSWETCFTYLYIFYIYTWYMHIFSLLPVLKGKIIPLRPIPKTNPAQHWLKNKTCKVVTPTLWTSAAPLTYTETFPSDLCSKMVYVHWMTQGL